MEVQFRTKALRLRKQYKEGAEAVRAYGEQIARKYILRINTIKAARNLDELTRLPAIRCHPLKGKQKGQWSMNLAGRYRLIFTLKGTSAEVVCIEEVSKHYGD